MQSLTRMRLYVKSVWEYIMQCVIVFSFCIVSFAFGADNMSGDDDLAEPSYGQMREDTNEDEDPIDQNNQRDDSGLDVNRYMAELAAGNPAEFRSSNVHYQEPRSYKNLGRRFVPVYPYKERKSPKKGNKHEDEDIEMIPKRAPPEVVLAVMKNAIKSDPLPKPSDPTEEVIRQYMLRSGDYWDGVWKEEVNPDNILRTNNNKIQASDEETEEADTKETVDPLPIKTKLVPGSKLYDLIAGVVRHSPRLVYIINDE